MKQGAPPQESPWTQNRLATMVTGDWQIASTRTTRPTWITAHLHPVPKEGDQSATWAGGWSMVIPQGAKEPDAAAKFLVYACGADGQRIYTKDTSHIPTFKALQSEKDLFTEQHLFFVEKLLPTAHNRPPLPVGAKYWDDLTAAFQKIYLNQEEPQAALDEAQKSTQAALGPFCPVSLGIPSSSGGWRAPPAGLLDPGIPPSLRAGGHRRDRRTSVDTTPTTSQRNQTASDLPTPVFAHSRRAQNLLLALLFILARIFGFFAVLIYPSGTHDPPELHALRRLREPMWIGLDNYRTCWMTASSASASGTRSTTPPWPCRSRCRRHGSCPCDEQPLPEIPIYRRSSSCRRCCPVRDLVHLHHAARHHQASSTSSCASSA